VANRDPTKLAGRQQAPSTRALWRKRGDRLTIINDVLDVCSGAPMTHESVTLQVPRVGYRRIREDRCSHSFLGLDRNSHLGPGMERIKNTLAVLGCFALLGTGCTHSELHMYRAPSLHVAAPMERVMESVRRMAIENAWHVVVDSSTVGWLEAETDVDTSEGMTTRERWVFSVRDHVVTACLSLERKVGVGDVWQVVDVVTDQYNYFRERDALGRIRRLSTTPHALADERVPWSVGRQPMPAQGR
jgi:hypothetical protein